MRHCLFTLFISLFAAITFSAYADEAASQAFTLNTNAFLDTGALPVLYTCDGKNVSPELDWTNVPAKTKSLAIIVSDSDAPSGTFYHWIVYNIPTTVKTMTETTSQLPAGAVAGKNDFGKMQYNGPCPPKGAAHTYHIVLYALDNKIDLPAGANGKTVMNAIQKHTVGKAELTTVYSRWLR